MSLVQEEHGLRIFESRVRRKLLGPKAEGVTGDCWKLNNEEFHDIQGVPGGMDKTSGECSLC